MNRGEIWAVELPSSNGREQAGRRPIVIVQEAEAGRTSPLVLIVPMSSRLEAARFPGCVVVQPTPDNGLSAPSVALGFQLRAIDRIRFRSRLGVLSEDDLNKVEAALKSLLGL